MEGSWATEVPSEMWLLQLSALVVFSDCDGTESEGVNYFDRAGIVCVFGMFRSCLIGAGGNLRSYPLNEGSARVTKVISQETATTCHAVI